MTPLVVAPLVVLVAVVAVLAWLAAKVAASVAQLRAELAVLTQLAAARELLVVDLERTRRTFHRTSNPAADVWPPPRRR